MEKEVPPTAKALLTLTNLEGIGPAKALRIVDECGIPHIPFSDHLEALSLWLSRHCADVSESELKEIWKRASEQLDETRGPDIEMFSFHAVHFAARPQLYGQVQYGVRNQSTVSSFRSGFITPIK